MGRKQLIAAISIMALATACQSPEGFQKPDDSLDAGRNFIRAVLDGDYNKAELYVMPDDEDRSLFKRYEAYMKKRPEEERLQLKSASIIINNIETVSDSVSIINYSNSYSKKPMDIKVVKKDGSWWVDFSYTFSGNLPAQ
jgi:hypothetical protein